MNYLQKFTTKWQLVLLFMVTVSFGYSQTNVTGVVTDGNDNTPLIGVNVLVQGSTSGTITDIDGRYSLSVPSDAVIEFSYTGYTSQEIAVGGRSQIDINLIEGTELDEVVVIGYGTVKKSDVTGAVTSVSSESYEDQPITRLEDALQGRAAGVSVAKANGQTRCRF